MRDINTNIELHAYTDASSYNNGRKNPKEPEHSGSAGVILFGDTVIMSSSSYNPNSSISYGELYSIYTTLNQVYELVNRSGKSVDLILHSDSAYCVQAITIWMKKWKSLSDGVYWYKSDGTKVAYQQLFQEIDRLLEFRHMNVKIKHIRGHIDMNKRSDVHKAIEAYKRFNKETIDFKELSVHTFYNDLCDRYAKKVLSLGMGGELEDGYSNVSRKVFEKYFS